MALVLVATMPAHADRIDDLSRVLAKDPSMRVRLQAVSVIARSGSPRAPGILIRALADKHEAVRAVAADALSSFIGQADVRAALERAAKDKSAMVRRSVAASLAKAREPVEKGPVRFQITGISAKGKGSGDLEGQLREFVTRELKKTPGVTLEGAQPTGFSLDSAITSLTQRNVGGWVEFSCEVSYIVGRLPSRAMVMMTSGGATVQATRAEVRLKKEKGLQVAALESAVQGAHANLLQFLRSQP